MKGKTKKIVKSKLNLKGKFGRNRKKKENMIRQKLLQEKEQELLSSMDLFSNSSNLEKLSSSKDLDKKVFEDSFVKSFLDKLRKSSQEEFSKRLESSERAKQVESTFSVTSMTHNILEITQSFSAFQGNGRIITSGKACHGQQTEFLKELSVGDTLCVQRSGTFKVEKRVINALLSDSSLCLAIPFKPGVSSFSKYSIEPKSSQMALTDRNHPQNQPRPAEQVLVVVFENEKSAESDSRGSERVGLLKQFGPAGRAESAVQGPLEE